MIFKSCPILNVDSQYINNILHLYISHNIQIWCSLECSRTLESFWTAYNILNKITNLNYPSNQEFLQQNKSIKNNIDLYIFLHMCSLRNHGVRNRYFQNQSRRYRRMCLLSTTVPALIVNKLIRVFLCPKK